MNAEPETPLTSALAWSVGEKRSVCRRRNMAEICESNKEPFAARS